MANISSSFWIFFFIFSCFCISFALCSVFDTILDDEEPCKEVCDKTYPLHTYPNPKHSECCKRGCRFFSLVEFLHQGQQQNVNSTKDACMASCMEAYSETGDRYACNNGCSSQVPYTVQLKQVEITGDVKKDEETQTMTKEETKSDDDDDDDGDVSPPPPQSMHVLTPFLYVHNIYNSMLDKMSRMMSVSWSVYFQQDDGKMVIVQSEPEIVAEYLDMEDVEDKNKDDDDLITAEENVNSLLRDQSVFRMESANKHLPDIYYYQRQTAVGGGGGGVSSSGGDVPIRITVSAYSSEELQSVDWLGCVSRKSGLPRWLLGVIIFFSAVVMVWLCFATSVTAPEHRIKTQVISIPGDLGYLNGGGCIIHEKQNPQLIMCNIYGNKDKDDESRDAGPLPSKEELQRLV